MDDKRIIQAVKEGNREIFGLLMDRYQSTIYLMCLRMTGDIFLSRELVHDSFVEAYLKIDQLTDPSKFESWVRRIALNLCRMWFRKNKRIFMEIPEEQPEGSNNEEDNEDLHIQMAMGMVDLSSAHRLILVLHYFEKLSYEEIAGFLEIPAGTVMSRLYRARNELKNRMEVIMEETEIDISNMDMDDFLKEEIEAEISVLLEMFNDKKDSIEPLKVILERSPERLIQFISMAENDDILEKISILINRLERNSIRDILKTCFSGDKKASDNALKVMIRAINRCEPYYSKNRDSIASFRSYIILDELIKLPVGDSKKADFLMDTLLSCREKSTCVLIINCLLCYPEEAFPVLMEYLKETGSNEDLIKQPFVLHALSRMYNKFLAELSEMLISTDYNELWLALSGVEAIGNCLQLAETVDYVSNDHILNDIRMGSSAMKWIPIKREALDKSVFDGIRQRISIHLNHPDTVIREKSIRCIGLLKASEYSQKIRECLSHSESSTRIASLLTLADLNSYGAADLFIKFAEQGTEEEKNTAVEALGRLKIKESVSLLKKMVFFDNIRLRKASITALGEMEDKDVDEFLKTLLESDNIQLRKVAARVIFGGKIPERRGLAAEHQRLARLRGSKIPFVMNSMDAAIRYAIPEIRKYNERELTGLLAGVCHDFSTTRRDLVEAGLFTRSNGVCELTDRGKTVWRVEHFIMEKYAKN